MLTAILVVHIGTALIMGVIALQSFVLMWKGQLGLLPSKAKNLSILFFAQIFSGSGLGLFSPTFSATNFCSNIVFYILAYIVVEVAILAALKKGTLNVFPYKYAFISVGASLVLPLFVLLVRVPLF